MKAQQQSNSDTFVEDVCRMVIRPIVGILLRIGLPFAHFSEIARSVYVDVASQEFGVDGRRTNTSRIALITGLSRTRVKCELDALAGSNNKRSGIEQVRPASRMLMAWHVDPDFVDKDGEPLLLTIDQGFASFKRLYERYSGKIVPMTAMLKELQTVGSVEKTQDGLLKVLSRTYTPSPTDPAAIERVCLAVCDLAETGAYNIYREASHRSRFERFATNRLVPVDELDNFTDFLNSEAQAFLERADDWLSSRESDDFSREVIRTGVGIYQIAPPGLPGAKKNNENK